MILTRIQDIGGYVLIIYPLISGIGLQYSFSSFVVPVAGMTVCMQKLPKPYILSPECDSGIFFDVNEKHMTNLITDLEVLKRRDILQKKCGLIS